jgi:hypothetical protein
VSRRTEIVHGTNTAYVGGRTKKGCRCAECREAHRVHVANHRATVKLPPPGHPAHGTRNGFDYYACRCQACGLAHAAALREYYTRDLDRSRARGREKYRRAVERSRQLGGEP